MDHLPTDHVSESSPVAHEAPSPAATLGEHPAFDQHREINDRRAQLENPELLRRIRSL